MHVLRGLESFVGDAARVPGLAVHHRPQPGGRRRPGPHPTPLGVRRRRHRAAPGPAPAVRSSAEDPAIDNDGTARALRLVATLPPAQAEMVMLRVVAGLDVSEVAEIWTRSPARCGSPCTGPCRPSRATAIPAAPQPSLTRGGVTWPSSSTTPSTTTRWCDRSASLARPASWPTRTTTSRCSARRGPPVAGTPLPLASAPAPRRRSTRAPP